MDKQFKLTSLRFKEPDGTWREATQEERNQYVLAVTTHDQQPAAGTFEVVWSE